MKQNTKIFKTDRYEIHLVTHELEKADFKQGSLPVGGPMMIMEPIDLPTNYMLIGPVGGPLARLDGIDLAVLDTLIRSVQVSEFMGPPRRNTCFPGA